MNENLWTIFIRETLHGLLGFPPVDLRRIEAKNGGLKVFPIGWLIEPSLRLFGCYGQSGALNRTIGGGCDLIVFPTEGVFAHLSMLADD